ncbi:hypothetical protein BKA70DRAFT_1443234 [Coprinopsis sp. MPI-PUGE-AT-0042]|nr:hypothetical protein BKA70DRAFT_1443234 [Coprinopsis sp. MPI-PUGE-AT-0042]
MAGDVEVRQLPNPGFTSTIPHVPLRQPCLRPLLPPLKSVIGGRDRPCGGVHHDLEGIPGSDEKPFSRPPVLDDVPGNPEKGDVGSGRAEKGGGVLVDDSGDVVAQGVYGQVDDLFVVWTQYSVVNLDVYLGPQLITVDLKNLRRKLEWPPRNSAHPQLIFSFFILILASSVRLGFTTRSFSDEPLNRGLPFHDPIVAELLSASLIAMPWSGSITDVCRTSAKNSELIGILILWSF